MGVGYSVSPLHRIIHFDASPVTSRPPIKGINSPKDRVAELTGTSVGVGTPRLYSPTIEEILVWRQGVATKYRDQLEEGLTWDEGSTFEVSEDVATSGDVMFHYVAAVLDQQSKSELSKLINVGQLPAQQLNASNCCRLADFQRDFAPCDYRGGQATAAVDDRVKLKTSILAPPVGNRPL
jgi:hypothetical protein